MSMLTLFVSLLALQEPSWRLVGSSEPLPGSVQRFVVAPDGARVATMGEDALLVLWDAQRGSEIARFPGAAPYGTLLAFSADSKLLAAHVPLWVPTSFRAWNAADGKELTGWSTIELGPGDPRESEQHGSWREGAQLHLHPSGATIFHPSDYRSLVVSSSRTLAPARVETHRRWFVLQGGRIVAVPRTSGTIGGPLPDGQREDELDVRLFRVEDGVEVAHVHWKELQPEDLPFPADHLAITKDELVFPVRGEARVLGLDGRERARFGKDVSALVRSGELVITGHRNGSIAFWRGTQRVASVSAIGKAVRGLECDGERVLVEGDGSYALVDASRRLLGPREAREGTLRGSVTLLRDGDERLHLFDDDRPLRELRLATWIYDEYDNRNVPCELRGDVLWYLDGGVVHATHLRKEGELFASSAHRAAIERVHFGPAGAVVSTHRESMRVDAHGAPTGEPLDTAAVAWFGDAVVRLDGDPGHRARYAFARKGAHHAIRVGDKVRVFGGDGTSTEHELGHAGVPIALSSDGKLLGAAWRDGRSGGIAVRVLRLPEGTPVWSTKVPGAGLDFVDFAPVGTDFAVCGGFGVHVFDAAGKQRFESRSGPARMDEDVTARSFDWTSDGGKLVTVSHARPVHVRDARTGTELLQFDAPGECYGHFARLWLAPDGAHFAAGYSERDVVYVWSTTTGRTGELRISTSSASEPVAWLSASELVAATPEGAAIVTLPTGERELLPVPRSPTGVFADAAGRRIAVVDRSRLFLFERR